MPLPFEKYRYYTGLNEAIVPAGKVIGEVPLLTSV